jgi:hypothetical protein
MHNSQRGHVHYWDIPYAEPPKVKPCTYTGPRSRPKKPREHWVEVDRSETQAVAARKQHIRQSLAVRDALEEEKRRDDELYQEKCDEVNERLAPYLQFVNELERQKGGSGKVERDLSREKVLEQVVRDAMTSPTLVFHNAVMLDMQSQENREKKRKQQAEEKERQARYEKRGATKKQFYELWGS